MLAEKQIYHWLIEAGSEVNLALMGLRLREYIDVISIGREVGGAIAHCGRSLISMILLFIDVM